MILKSPVAVQNCMENSEYVFRCGYSVFLSIYIFYLAVFLCNLICCALQVKWEENGNILKYEMLKESKAPAGVVGNLLKRKVETVIFTNF